MSVIAIPAGSLNEFWRGIFPNGMTIEDVTKELIDFEKLIHNVPKIFDHVTGGKVSKHLTDVDVVCSLHDEYVQVLVDEAVAENTRQQGE